MFLIVGLGNPGKKYQDTRHNIGFTTLVEFVKKNNFPDFQLSKKNGAEISENMLNNQKVVLIKPQTFMNNSGIVIKKIIRNLNFEVRNLIVVHDDIDLPLGKIRISKGRGAAGHKGVESIIKELGTKNFIRFRIGIINYKSGIKKTENFVLKKFTKKEEEVVKEVLEKTVEAIEFILKNGLEKAMSKFNK